LPAELCELNTIAWSKVMHSENRSILALTLGINRDRT
jgi:hypothetical protein